MAGRVTRLFDRYAARHLVIRRTGPRLFDAAGQIIGQIDSIGLRNDRLVVEGHCAADHVALELAGRRRGQTPGANAMGGTQFRLELQAAADTPVFSHTQAGVSQSFDLPGFSRFWLNLARLTLWPRFGLDSLRALPAGYRWLRHHDVRARARVKTLLGLGAMVEEMQLDPAFVPVAVAPAAAPGSTDTAAAAAPPLPLSPPLPAGVIIVLPVYQAMALLPEVLERVQRHTDLPWRLILIEDASPDPSVRPFLRGWATGRANVTLIENPTNLGFIGSVNLGLARVAGQGDPVILLNSDAFVPAGWASRLIAPLLADPWVATVTPMSNDAELMSVPVICKRCDLAPGAVDAIDKVARGLGPLPVDLPETPTGVGFCMAISPAFLARLPQLDTAFGRGYGEEVDWCQKVRALNGRHLCLPSLFVEHRGGSSFGAAAKQALLRRNGALISARYPGFDLEVQRFIADDPLVTARLALALAFAAAEVAAAEIVAAEVAAAAAAAAAAPAAPASRLRVPIYLAHAMGGGAEHYLRSCVARDLRELGVAVVLRVGGEYRWKIALHCRSGITRGATNDTALMLRLLRLLPARNVIYSCGVADPDPVELPAVLLALGQDQRLEVLIHDYLPISPSQWLLDAGGAFNGVPQVAAGRVPRGHDIQRPDGSWVDLAQWQAAWRPLLAQAAAVVVFSQTSWDLMQTAYPEARLALRPHALLRAVPRLAAPPGAPPVIGVLGHIGMHKGAGLLVALSRLMARTRDADLVVIGHVDPNFDLASPARVHGGYEVGQIGKLAQRYGVNCWLIPSIWPETFSYTTHEALATGLPVICFDLGAQAEAVRQAIAAGAPGAVLPLPESQADLQALLAQAKALCGLKEPVS